MYVFKKSYIKALTLILFYQIAISFYQIEHATGKYFESVSSHFKPQNKVVIATVFCRRDKSDLVKNLYFEQSVVLLKSILISAHLYNISTVEIHLFLEHIKEDGPNFNKEILKHMAIPGVTVNLQIHPVVDTVPKKHKAHMIYHHRFRCSFVRLYLPEVLQNVDSVIYLDSDMIVTGDLRKHWQLLSEMNDHQMLAMGRNSPAENEKFLKIHNKLFGDTPYIPPRAVNAGLMVMNLTKMRQFEMSKKLTRIYEDYSKVAKVVCDQRAINILLYYNPEMLHLMPCNLHYLGAECQDGTFYCQAALKDPEGIHLVHGTNHKFMKGNMFHTIFKFYQKFDVSNLDSSKIETHLMKPIKQEYSNKSGKKPSCPGILSELLFKRIL